MNNIYYHKAKYSGIKAFLIFAFVFTIIICFYPYEFQSCYFMVFPKEGPSLQIFATIISLLAYLLLGRGANLPKIIWPLLLFQLIGFSLCYIVQGQPQVILITLVVTTLFISLLALINATIGLVVFFKYYNRWILIMAILGVIAWILSSFFGFQPLYVVPDVIDEDRELYNYILTFSVHNSYQTTMRYSGFFDEPGAMANWGLFALLINRLFVHDKKLELPLIACLLFTFSMGFYVQLILYFLFFYTKKENYKQGILVVAATAIIIFAFSTMKEGTGVNYNRSVYSVTIGRFTEMFEESRKSNSVVAVDDRKGLTEMARQEFLHHPLFGTNKKVYLGDNIYEPLAMYGLVGTFFIYFPIIWLLFSSYKRGDKEVFRAAIIIVIGFAHRPYHRNPLWNIIIYGIIILYMLSRQQRKMKIASYTNKAANDSDVSINTIVNP